MKTVLWIVGEPATGKTTLARNLLGDLSRYTAHENPKWTVNQGLGPQIVASGHYRGGAFDGADRVPYNGVTKALDYWEENLADFELTIFDGDRFSHRAVVERLAPRVERLCCVLLVGDQLVVSARRDDRSLQNESWAKGRKTKARRFAESFPDRWLVDVTTKTREEVLFEVENFLRGPERKEPVNASQASMFPYDQG